ncbi:ATP-binding cassette domain-containing protein [Sedimentibacter sp. zth1]|uniref:ATP-binding cassette domain-containing protein n=1 Tax=Sedimentibacter sp. zth1 TaxID=2816908 RepID=UPI001A9274C0|nr:ATP-binding cassette domain-containing protein [Sedimentibacter sp. zth1]QSX05677.1 ATP-binding cassette domain-containing protein [Sedimentibacter sp. zth1]
MKKTINKDVFRWMIIPIISDIISNVSVSVIAVKIAEYLGSMTDAVFMLDFSTFNNGIKKLIFYMVLNLLLIPLISIINDFIFIRFGTKSDDEMCTKIPCWEYHKLMQIPEGEISYRLEEELCEFRVRYAATISNIISIPIIAIYLFNCSEQLGWLYTLIALVVSALKLIIPFATKNVSVAYDKSSREYGSKVKNELIEISENACDIKLLGIEKAYFKKLNKLFKDYFNKVQKKDIKLKSASDGGKALLAILSKLIVILVGCYLVANGNITAGCIVIMMNYQSIYDDLMNKLSSVITGIPSLKMQSKRLGIFYDEAESMDGDNIGKEFKIIADQLSFDYDGKVVFNNLSFNIKSKDKIAICGKNGSGKSTLFKIICGLEKNYKGSIKVNNVEMQDANIVDWRNRISVVFQEPYLFSGTVDENIGLGNLNASETEIEDVMEKTGIRYLCGKEIKYDTEELSGGEKQRISIARALLKNTDILLLDEPSNNLDCKAIEWLSNFIAQTKKTIIFITHDTNLMKISNYCINMNENLEDSEQTIKTV